MKGDIAFVGNQDRVYQLCDLEYPVLDAKYRVLRFYGFNEFASALGQGARVLVAVIYGFEDIYSNHIDRYTGKLPPLIYWHIPLADSLPKRSHVRCVECGILPEQLMRIIRGIINNPG